MKAFIKTERRYRKKRIPWSVGKEGRRERKGVNMWERNGVILVGRLKKLDEERNEKGKRRGGVIRKLPRQTQEKPSSTSRNLIIAAKYHEAQILAWPPSVIRLGPQGKYDYVWRVKRESKRQLGMDVIMVGVTAPFMAELRPRVIRLLMIYFPIHCLPFTFPRTIFFNKAGRLVCRNYKWSNVLNSLNQNITIKPSLLIDRKYFHYFFFIYS